MYTSETKTRQLQAMKKLTPNPNKSQNNSAASRTASKLKEVENQIKITPQINKLNLSKSKFVVTKSLKLSKQPSFTECLSSKINPITKREVRKPDTVRKSNLPTKSASKTCMAVNKIVLTENVSTKRTMCRRRNKSPASAKLKMEVVDNKRDTREISVQTNELEILNHLLIVGDLKIITPSKPVADELDRLQKAKEKEKLLKAKRKFEEHSQRDEQHLDDLNEFLDKSSIKRKHPKISYNCLDEDRQLIESMDELLQREKPKTESITDIRSRIKQKERELLSLFDRFQKTNVLLAK